MRVRHERIWDLSQPVCHDGPCWPDHQPPQVRRLERRAVEGANTEWIAMNTHTGTHVDAPFHFVEDGPTVDRLPLGAFCGPALFVDLRERVEPAAEIGPDQLDSWVGALRPGDFAVLVTGWGDRRALTDEFMHRYPYLGGEGARLLLDHGVAGVGIDALSIGGWGGPEVGDPSHEVLLGAGKVIVEELHIPDELCGRRAFLTAFPILLAGAGGAPARAVAWEVE
ncbi:MAG: cyclase family protein [Actinobacteria bacterium]|nr:cyclase family protein [Actinomycetota bacterium]